LDHNKKVRNSDGARSYGLETSYDLRTYITPFDLTVLENEIKF
jgi:hypothetical protein